MVVRLVGQAISPSIILLASLVVLRDDMLVLFNAYRAISFGLLLLLLRIANLEAFLHLHRRFRHRLLSQDFFLHLLLESLSTFALQHFTPDGPANLAHLVDYDGGEMEEQVDE